MDQNELKKKLYAKIDELPTLPVVITRLLTLLEDPEFDMGELTDLISQDPALTAKVLKVANSAYYGFIREIATLDRAVSVLGQNMIKSLTLSMGVVDTLPKSRESGLLSLGGLWLHSVAAASVIRELGRRQGRGAMDDHLFVSGLLHDVGKIVLLHFFYDLYEQALRQTQESGDSRLYLAEREIIGMDHGRVGAMLLNRWKFPPQVVGPIMLHHQHDENPKSLEKDVVMLRLANQVPQMVGLGQEGNPAPPTVSPADLKVLGMDQAELDDLIQFAESSREGIESFFEAMM